MSPVLVQTSLGGNAGLRCHMLPVLAPAGSHTASDVIVILVPTAAVPAITGADNKI